MILTWYSPCNNERQDFPHSPYRITTHEKRKSVLELIRGCVPPSSISPTTAITMVVVSCLPCNSSSCYTTRIITKALPSRPSRQQMKWSTAAKTAKAAVSSNELSSSLSAEKDKEKGEEEDKGKFSFSWYSHWYPVAPEYDMDKGVPHAFTVLGLELVVWWDRHSDKWVVFEDSCPHRRAPLSQGRIAEDGTLQCCYHGWCFSSLGNCIFIPQMPSDGPPAHTSKRACTSVYPSVLQQGILWFWPSTDAQFKTVLLKKKPPVIPGLSDPSFQSHFPAMRDLPYGYEVLTENLLDPSHFPYAHYGLSTVGGSQMKAKSRQKAGRPMDMNIARFDEFGFETQLEQGSFEFIPPCVIVAKFMVKPSKEERIKLSENAAVEKQPKTVYVLFLCIPVSAGRSRVMWAFPRNFALWADAIFRRWMAHITSNLTILDSDLYMLHLEEKKLAMKNWEKACYIPASADALVVAFRRWLKNHAGGGIDWGNNIDGSLPSVISKEQLMDRYQSHVATCRSCSGALKVFRAFEVLLQILSLLFVGLLGIIGTTRQTSSSAPILRITLLTTALLCFIASKWLSHFIYKSFYFHDYNHATVK